MANQPKRCLKDVADDTIRCMNIDDVRKNIDTVDKQLIKLLAVRMAYVTQIGELKRKQGMEPLQTDRYQAMVLERAKVAAELGVSEELVSDVFGVIHAHSVAAQSGK